MTNNTYLSNRWKLTGLRQRPQAIAWAESYTTTEAGLIVPEGNIEGQDFLILSDHNRSEINFGQQRLETRQRMVSGSLRSYHVADKLTISWSWQMLPSRAYSGDPDFNTTTGLPNNSGLTPYTVDNGAGGVDVLNWYEDHPGSFYMFLAYDRYDKFNDNYSRFNEYNQVVEVMFSSFDYGVVKRGGSTHDFWNINVSVEEV